MDQLPKLKQNFSNLDQDDSSFDNYSLSEENQVDNFLNQELIPRQSSIRKPLVDFPVTYFSMPFMQERLHLHQFLTKGYEDQSIIPGDPKNENIESNYSEIIERKKAFSDRQKETHETHHLSFNQFDSIAFRTKTSKKSNNVIDQKVQINIIQKNQSQSQADFLQQAEKNPSTISIVSKSSERQNKQTEKNGFQSQQFNRNLQKYSISAALIKQKLKDFYSISSSDQGSKDQSSNKNANTEQTDSIVTTQNKLTSSGLDPHSGQIQDQRNSSGIMQKAVSSNLCQKYEKGFSKEQLKSKQQQQISNNHSSPARRSEQYTISFSQRSDLSESKEVQEVLVKNFKQIELLRSELLKSTQNNINAIFNSQITADEIQLTELVREIRIIIGGLSQKVSQIQNGKIREIQSQIADIKQRSHLKSRQVQIQIDGQFKQGLQRREELCEKSCKSKETGNMILDLGMTHADEGRIITIYPANQFMAAKDLIFNRNSIQEKQLQQATDSNVKMLLEMQQKFVKTLNQFQDSLNTSIQKKIQTIKIELKHSQIEQNQAAMSKLQRVSRQTADRDEDYDDSRGSINVIYIQKLRQMQKQIQCKQQKIEKLEKRNSHLEKQLQTIQSVTSNIAKVQANVSANHPLEMDLARSLHSKKNAFCQKPFVLTSANVSPPSQQFAACNNFSSCLDYCQPLKGYPKQISPINEDQQKKIKQAVSLTNEQMNQLNLLSKKKITHSLHRYDSKNLQVAQLYQKLNQYQRAFKQKDLRIKELENVILEHFQKAGKQPLQKSDQQKTFRILNSRQSSSVKSKEQNPEILHMKIKNFKTLLKKAENSIQIYQKLYEDEKALNLAAQGITKQRNADDMLSNQSKSMCVSSKTTVKNEHHLNDDSDNNNELFGEVVQKDLTIQKISQTEKFQGHELFISEKEEVEIIKVLASFIAMTWNLQELLTNLGLPQLNKYQINQKAIRLLNDLKRKSPATWRKTCQMLKSTHFSANLKGVWL